MKRFILLLLLTLPLVLRGGQAPYSPWKVWNWGSSGKYVPANAYGSGTNIATFNLPQTGRNVAYPAFLMTSTNLNLTGKTVSATFNVPVTGSPAFVWGGLLSGWNTSGLPANTRLFLSAETGYSNAAYTARPTNFWWSHTWVELSETTGAAQIFDTLNPANWSDANGRLGTDPAVAGAFANALANTKQIGLAFCGGSFFDVGVAVLNGTGTSQFNLSAFTVE